MGNRARPLVRFAILPRLLRVHRRYPKTSRFQPSAHPPNPPTARRTDAPTAEELKAAADAVAAAGAKVKALKAAGATNSDEAVVAGVATLKELKAELAALEVAAGVTPPPAPEKPKSAQQKKGGGKNQQKKGGGGGNSKGGDAEGAGTSSAEEVKALRIAKVAQLRDAGAEPFAEGLALGVATAAAPANDVPPST